jgi:hypothetical protein
LIEYTYTHVHIRIWMHIHIRIYIFNVRVWDIFQVALQKGSKGSKRNKILKVWSDCEYYHIFNFKSDYEKVVPSSGEPTIGPKAQWAPKNFWKKVLWKVLFLSIEQSQAYQNAFSFALSLFFIFIANYASLRHDT